ncbi:MAG: ATP-binding protein [Spirochaetes bacterium]|nr:ATP-binding protein [Spirochaetota bacterium]
MILAIASGKGGTGKTTISLAIAYFLNKRKKSLSIFDCDVEEPNVNLFLNSDIKVTETVYIPVPTVNEEKCNGCGKCEDICKFNAVVLVKGKPLIFPDICHSCGGCKLVCPTGAMNEEVKEIGKLEEGYFENIRYIGGTLKIGEAISPPLINSVKKHIIENEINIIDAPPGTTCPVVESIKGCDYLVLVTEPTPFGLHDLKLSVGMARELELNFGVVINKSDIGDSKVAEYCNAEKIDILAEIPNSLELARGYASGNFMNVFLDNFSDKVERIISKTGIGV